MSSKLRELSALNYCSCYYVLKSLRFKALFKLPRTIKEPNFSPNSKKTRTDRFRSRSLGFSSKTVHTEQPPELAAANRSWQCLAGDSVVSINDLSSNQGSAIIPQSGEILAQPPEVTMKAMSAKSPARTAKKARIGLYDGTFSPIHYGHLICAERTRQVKNLDRVLFLTCGNPPNKSGVLDAEVRHEMVVATVSDNPHFEASRISINQKGVGYTLMAVERVKEEYESRGEEVELFYLTSSEYLDPKHKWFMGKWTGGKELFKLVTILVFPRNKEEVDRIREWAGLIPEARIEAIEVPSPELSSTMIRESVSRGRSIWYRLPWVTQQMIAKYGIYRDSQTPAVAPVRALELDNIKHVGIYGGQFDPIHYGHLLLAEWAREEYGMDVVEFVTSATPPHNKQASVSAEARHEMVVAATADNPNFRTSRVDLDRGTTSYALLTANDMRLKYGEGVELSMFIAADYLDPKFEWRLTEWMGFPELASKVRFLVFPTGETSYAQAVKWAKQMVRKAPGARIEVMDAPRPNVSSGMIRQWISRGESAQYTTPWVVQQIIGKRGLYRQVEASATAGKTGVSPRPARGAASRTNAATTGETGTGSPKAGSPKAGSPKPGNKKAGSPKASQKKAGSKAATDKTGASKVSGKR